MESVRPYPRTPLVAALPFIAAAVLTWVVVPIGSQMQWGQYWLSVALGVIASGLMVSTIAGRVRLGALPASMVFLAAVGLLRQSGGGLPTGAGALVVVPVFATALYSHSRRDLLGVLAAVAAFYIVPIVIVGGSDYPTTQYRAGLLSLAISSVIGLTTQHLVARVRGQAIEAHRREQTLAAVSQAVHKLLDSPDARTDVCAAARDISDARVAVIFEPSLPGGELRCTAISGNGLDEEPGAVQPPSGVYQAFASGRPVLVNSDVAGQVQSLEVWRAVGSPDSVLYQPLTRSGSVLGVLVVSWQRHVELDGPRCAVAALLAHEAAAVIARADVIDSLAGEAKTDALTGLANRRTWDRALDRALAGGRPLAVVMFDLDHFKLFNDRFGHPAGDELLVTTAVAWREQLREHDLLARLGGEEFGLLLSDGSAESALEIVERLRGCVPQGRTCSAGVAFRRRGESGRRLVARADAALYAAKAAGRDCARVSDPVPV